MLKEPERVVRCEVREEIVLCLIKGKGWYFSMKIWVSVFRRKTGCTLLNSYTRALWLKVLGVRIALKQNIRKSCRISDSVCSIRKCQQRQSPVGKLLQGESIKSQVTMLSPSHKAVHRCLCPVTAMQEKYSWVL